MSGLSKRPLSFEVTTTGCFEVTSHRSDAHGYPQLWHDGRPILAYRHIWQECFGEIPEGMVVCHKCDNRPCINPEHMFLGTQSENNHDMRAKGRGISPPHFFGEQNHSAKLTAESVREIRRRYHPYDPKNGRVALMREFGVSRATIQAVTSRRYWTHI